MIDTICPLLIAFVFPFFIFAFPGLACLLSVNSLLYCQPRKKTLSFSSCLHFAFSGNLSFDLWVGADVAGHSFCFDLFVISLPSATSFGGHPRDDNSSSTHWTASTFAFFCLLFHHFLLIVLATLFYSYQYHHHHQFPIFFFGQIYNSAFF